MARGAACLALIGLLAACSVYDDALLKRAATAGDGGPTTGDGDSSGDGDTDIRDSGPNGMDSGPSPNPDGDVIAPPADADVIGPDDDGGMIDPTPGPDASGFQCGDAWMDADSDGVEDCEDGCPNDGNKRTPGVCGCGNPDTDDGLSERCDGLRSMIRHRYRFQGTGNTAVDSVGGADGQVVGAALGGTGDLVLAGGTTNEHVVLPSGLLSPLPSATLEMWVTWTGSGAWQRVFDFGVDRPAPLGNASNCTTSTGPILRPNMVWYYFCTNPLNWASARNVCAGNGANLVQVNDAAEQAFVVASAPPAGFPLWIGANDRGTFNEGDWSWTANGSDRGGPLFWTERNGPENGRYNAWRTNEPNDSGGEDCGETNATGWNDADCGVTQGFICEAPSQADSPYSSLFLAATRANAAQPRVGVVGGGQASQSLDPTTDFPMGTLVHAVVVFDDAADRVELFLNGVSAGSMTTTMPLSALRDVQNYLGRSHYSTDAEFGGTLHEFRIYDSVLSRDLIAISGRAGPDPSFLE